VEKMDISLGIVERSHKEETIQPTTIRTIDNLLILEDKEDRTMVLDLTIMGV